MITTQEPQVQDVVPFMFELVRAHHPPQPSQFVPFVALLFHEEPAHQPPLHQSQAITFQLHQPHPPYITELPEIKFTTQSHHFVQAFEETVVLASPAHQPPAPLKKLLQLSFQSHQSKPCQDVPNQPSHPLAQGLSQHHQPPLPQSQPTLGEATILHHFPHQIAVREPKTEFPQFVGSPVVCVQPLLFSVPPAHQPPTVIGYEVLFVIA